MWLLERRAGELAESLLESGITAMKIWPFDRFADKLADGFDGIAPEQVGDIDRPNVAHREAAGDDFFRGGDSLNLKPQIAHLGNRCEAL